METTAPLPVVLESHNMSSMYIVRVRTTPLPPPIHLNLEDAKAFNWLFDEWPSHSPPLPTHTHVHGATTKSGKLRPAVFQHVGKRGDRPS
jgi:hypothetical protein